MTSKFDTFAFIPVVASDGVQTIKVRKTPEDDWYLSKSEALDRFKAKFKHKAICVSDVEIYHQIPNMDAPLYWTAEHIFTNVRYSGAWEIEALLTLMWELMQRREQPKEGQ